MSAPSADLSGTKWLLVQLGGDPVEQAGERAPHLVLDPADSRAYGSGGCNRFTGSFELGGDELRFGPIVATRMACSDLVMRVETAFFDALASVTRYELDGELLVLLDDDGVVARLAASSSDEFRDLRRSYLKSEPTEGEDA
jgi:heat shock protein HslJ